MKRSPGLFGLIYLIIGFVVAANRGYFADITTLSHIISAVLVVLLWPLVFFGVHFTISV